MRFLVNRRIFTRTVLDSGSLMPMAAVMHRFTEPGSYTATVHQGGVPCATFALMVSKDAPATLNAVNLSSPSPSYTVSSEMQTLFTAPRGTEGYFVVVERFAAGGRSTVFDSRMLGYGDVFVTMLLRPGKYSASNQYGARCAISLTRAVKGFARQVRAKQLALYSKAESRNVECTKESFNPDKLSAEMAQPLLFNIRAKEPCMRITVTLETPECEPVGPVTGTKPVDATKVPKKPRLIKRQT